MSEIIRHGGQVIKKINLKGNRITWRGAVEVMKIEGLQEVILNENAIGMNVIQEIACRMQTCNIKSFSLSS
jgi:hypothetical protein